MLGGTAGVTPTTAQEVMITRSITECPFAGVLSPFSCAELEYFKRLHIHLTDHRELFPGRAIVRKNGKLFGSACGVEALGNPLSVVSWLANELAAHDRPLEAGHVVSTGSLLKIMPAEAGDTIEMSWANLGSIRFAIV